MCERRDSLNALGLQIAAMTALLTAVMAEPVAPPQKRGKPVERASPARPSPVAAAPEQITP